MSKVFLFLCFSFVNGPVFGMESSGPPGDDKGEAEDSERTGESKKRDNDVSSADDGAPPAKSPRRESVSAQSPNHSFDVLRRRLEDGGYFTPDSQRDGKAPMSAGRKERTPLIAGTHCLAASSGGEVRPRSLTPAFNSLNIELDDLYVLTHGGAEDIDRLHTALTKINACVLNIIHSKDPFEDMAVAYDGRYENTLIDLINAYRIYFYGRDLKTWAYMLRFKIVKALDPWCKKLCNKIEDLRKRCIKKIDKLSPSGLSSAELPIPRTPALGLLSSKLSTAEIARLRRLYRLKQATLAKNVLLAIYANIKAKDALLRISDPIEDKLTYELYDGLFFELLKIVKLIKNSLWVYGERTKDTTFADVTVIYLSNHILYLDKDKGGAHIFHKTPSTFDLSSGVEREVSIDDSSVEEVDENGIRSVRWNIVDMTNKETKESTTKESTLFPLCYHRNFLLYVETLFQHIAGNLKEDTPLVKEPVNGLVARKEQKADCWKSFIFEHNHSFILKQLPEAPLLCSCDGKKDLSSCDGKEDHCVCFARKSNPLMRVHLGINRVYVGKRESDNPLYCIKVIKTVYPLAKKKEVCDGASAEAAPAVEAADESK